MCRLEFNFQNLPFSKCAGKKMFRFRVNADIVKGHIRHIFHRFQNVPAWRERGLKVTVQVGCKTLETL